MPGVRPLPSGLAWTLALSLVWAVAAWGLAGCVRPPESTYLSPFAWEDAAPAGGAAAAADADVPPPFVSGIPGATDGRPVPSGTDGSSLPGSDSGPPPAPDAGAPPPQPYTIIAMPDTQFYAAFYPDIFEAQTRWIAGERAIGNVAFVVHEGDMVDSDTDAQWTVAARSMQLLDGVVPYVISMGNHDYGPGGDGWTATRSTMIDTYFPVWKYAPLPWFKGTFAPDHIENNYTLMDVPGGGQWLVVSLEFGPRDEVLTWADGIVKEYPNTPVMLVTHAYLFEDNTRYDHNASGQSWNPHTYPIAMTPGAVNDGEEIWQKLVLGNSNIQFVLCGHVLHRGVGRLTSTRPDGTTVNEILANYQVQDLGGGGYLRVMQFFPANRTVHVRTYSPYLDAFKTDPGNDFELSY